MPQLVDRTNCDREQLLKLQRAYKPDPLNKGLAVQELINFTVDYALSSELKSPAV